MSFSRRSRYGTRALLELALLARDRPVRLETLAENQKIPLRYLAKIAQDLKRAGLIRSVRGAHGGYMLAREPAQIVLADVVRCLDGSVSLVECADDPAVCEDYCSCVAREVWDQVNQAVAGVLTSVTVQDLAERCTDKRRKEARCGPRTGGVT